MSEYIEIGQGWDDEHPFIVMDRSESDWCIGTFRTRQEAVDYTNSYSVKAGFEIIMAAILPFSGGAAA